MAEKTQGVSDAGMVSGVVSGVGEAAPTVSIIVPAYNAEGSIRRCLDSILGQEYRDFELIVVDDGSADSTPALLDRYAANDARVRVIHRENGGVSSARNLALSLARGEWVEFLDSDDWMCEDTTKLLVRAAQGSGADMVIADFYRVVGQDVARKGQLAGFDGPITREQYADEMMKDPADFYYGVLWNKLYRRSLIERYDVRMDESLSWCEDFIFNLEYVLHARTIMPLHAPVYYYVKTEGSLVSRTDLADTVRMKRTVLGVYRDFYKDVFDEEEYRKRRMDVYRYLVSFATDDAAISGLPGTVRLGHERAGGYVPEGMRPNPFMGVYCAQRLISRYLGRVEDMSGLSDRQVRILVYVRYCAGTVDTDALADFTDSSRTALAMDLQHLIAEGYVRLGDGDRGLGIHLLDKAEPVMAAIDQAGRDFLSLLCSRLGGGSGAQAVVRGQYDALAEALSSSSLHAVTQARRDEEEARMEQKESERQARRERREQEAAQKQAGREAKKARKAEKGGEAAGDELAGILAQLATGMTAAYDDSASGAGNAVAGSASGV